MKKNFLTHIVLLMVGFLLGSTLKRVGGSPLSHELTNVTSAKYDVASCERLIENNNFSDLLSLFKKQFPKNDSDQNESQALAKVKMTKMLPSLSVDELLKLFEVNPEFVYSRATKLNSDQLTAIENKILSGTAESNNPSKYFNDHFLKYVENFGPLSIHFLKSSFALKDVNPASFSIMMYNQYQAWNKEGLNLQPLADVVLNSANDNQKELLLSEYVNALADNDPAEAYDAYLNLKKNKYIKDEYNNQVGRIVSNSAYKSIDRTIDFINENENNLKGAEHMIAGNLALSLLDKYPNDILRYIEKLNSPKIQLEAARTVFSNLKHTKTKEELDAFVDQLAENPKLLAIANSEIEKYDRDLAASASHKEIKN